MYWNTSTGGVISFDPTPLQLADSNAQAFAIADVDGDTFADLAVAPSSLYLNNVGRVLTDHSQIPNQQLSGASTVAVVLTDIDKDGDNDLITGLNNAPDHVFTNDGTGLFSLTTQLLGGSLQSSQGIAPGGTNTKALAVGDINNDGFIDLVAGNYEQVNRTFFNDQSGVFEETPQLLDSSNTFGLVCTDLNADGTPDLVAGNSQQTNRVYLNNSQGVFSDTLQLIGNADTRAIAVGDLDGNGFPDLVTGNFGEPNQAYSNNGTGHFDEPAAQTIGTAATRALVLADVDNDLDLDLVVGNHGEADQVFINEGFTTNIINFVELAQPNFDLTGVTATMALGDLDLDSDLDLVVGVDGGPNKIYLNKTVDQNPVNGLFVDSSQSLDNVINSSTVAVLLGDIDQDGDLDLVVGNSMEQPGAVYKNDGQGKFTDTGQLLGQTQTTALKLADIDQDGDLDLIEGNYAAPNNVYKNDGNGTFTFNLEALGKANTNTLDLCDIDGDSDLDLIEGNFGQINWTFENLTVR